MRQNTKQNEEQVRTRRMNIDELRSQLAVPPVNYQQKTFRSVEEVRQAFGLPASLGLPKEGRLAMDEAFTGYGAIFESLTQHAVSLGQYPMTSFIGYGVLQQISQNGMIRTCVQTVADDMTREWITISGGDDSNPETITNLQDIQDSKYKLRSLFNKALATVGYMGGAFIFIDTGVSDEDLEIPLTISKSNEELVGNKEIRFTLVDPVNVSPGDYNADNPLHHDYMKPRYWWVLGKKVHASRMIALLDNQPPVLLRPAYNFLGIPQAQILWDYVLHWNKARETGVNILEKLNFMVFQTSIDDILSAGGLNNLDIQVARMSRYRDNNSIFVCDKNNEDVKNVTLTISGVVDIIRQALEFIASINRTPAVKLLGISPSGFNATGESDIRNYYDHIRSKQELNRDSIQTLLTCIQLAEYGEVDSSITFKFNELGSDDDTSTASTAKTRTDTLTTLLDRNVISAEEVRTAVRNDPMMGLDFLGEELPEPVEGELQTDTPNGGGQQGLPGSGSGLTAIGSNESLMEHFFGKQEQEQQPEPQSQSQQENNASETKLEQVNANETQTQSSESGRA